MNDTAKIITYLSGGKFYNLICCRLSDLGDVKKAKNKQKSK